MRSIRVHSFGGPEVLQYENVADPKPGNGEVLIRARAIGVNPVDTYIRAGSYGDRPFPFTPGLDAAGVVEAIGSGVKSFKKGERVYVKGSLSGTYAELILCKESQVHPLPKKVSFPQGAGIGVPYTTAYFALVNRAQSMAGEWVLIHGASGGVGVAAIQIARDRKLKIIGTAGTPRGRALVKEQGAHYVLDHSATGYRDEIMKISEGQGVSIIVEMLANVNLGNDLKMLSQKGRVIVVGSRGPIEIDPRDTMTRHADIRGMSLMTVSEKELSQIHIVLGKGLARETLRPVVGKEIPLAQAAKAHEEVMKQGAHGKIILIP